MRMFKLQSVTGRVAVGKAIGLVVGLIVMFVLPLFGYPGFGFTGFGILIMFILMGAMIGFIGQFDRHPMLDFKMSWWMRGAMVGLSFMLMFVLLSYDSLEIVMKSSLISWTGLVSPFWALIDGAIAGLIMGYVETKMCGEGKDLPLS